MLLGLTREVVAPDQGVVRVLALFAYWFVGRVKVAATTWQRLWHTALNRLRLKPDRWAYVVVQTAVLPGETEELAQRRMERVAKALRDPLPPVRGEFFAEALIFVSPPQHRLPLGFDLRCRLRPVDCRE